MLVLKIVFLPPLLLATAAFILYGAFIIVLERPLMRLVGLGMVLGGIAVWSVGLWLAFGTPRDWFEPGRNTSYDPRR